MLPKIKHVSFLSLVLLSYACVDTWVNYVSTNKVNVYLNADEKDEVIFSIDQGKTCLLGKETLVKAYKYRQIKCDKGEGWVIYPYQFKLTESRP